MKEREYIKRWGDSIYTKRDRDRDRNRKRERKTDIERKRTNILRET